MTNQVIPLPYLSAYPAALQDRVRAMLAELKGNHLRKAGTLHKVAYDNKIHVVRNALGLHTRRSAVQGSRLNTRHAIQIAAM